MDLTATQLDILTAAWATARDGNGIVLTRTPTPTLTSSPSMAGSTVASSPTERCRGGGRRRLAKRSSTAA
jgi:hypothetical protein